MKLLCLPGRMGASLLARALACVLSVMLPLPALAVTNATPTAAPVVLMTEIEMGVIERFTSTSIQVGGKTFFLPAAAAVYDRDGNRLAAPRIELGAQVKFTLTDERPRQRIKQLWLIQ